MILFDKTKHKACRFENLASGKYFGDKKHISALPLANDGLQ